MMRRSEDVSIQQACLSAEVLHRSGDYDDFIDMVALTPELHSHPLVRKALRRAQKKRDEESADKLMQALEATVCKKPSREEVLLVDHYGLNPEALEENRKMISAFHDLLRDLRSKGLLRKDCVIEGHGPLYSRECRIYMENEEIARTIEWMHENGGSEYVILKKPVADWLKKKLRKK